MFSCIVFCDVSKAFDRVWHKGLLFQLRQNGIEGKLLEWFNSYLSQRKQKVGLKSCFSGLKSIFAGVPQGSVLGPLLFLVYINDIAKHLLSLTRLFADDSSLFYSAAGGRHYEIKLLYCIVLYLFILICFQYMFLTALLC